MVFESMVQTMVDMGLLQLFFPWLLITSITYGALTAYGEFDEVVVGAIAASVGFISLAGIYMFLPAGLFPHFGAALGFIVFGFLGLIIMMGMAGAEISDIGDKALSNKFVMAGIVLISLAFLGVMIIQFDVNLGAFSIDLSDEALLQIGSLAFVLVVLAIVTLGAS